MQERCMPVDLQCFVLRKSLCSLGWFLSREALWYPSGGNRGATFQFLFFPFVPFLNTVGNGLNGMHA